MTASQNSSAENSGEFWRTYSAYTSGYQSVDRLSDIDEFEESFRYLSVMDKTRHYYTLCRAASPIDTPPGTPTKDTTLLSVPEDEGVPEMEYEDEFEEVPGSNPILEDESKPVTEDENETPTNNCNNITPMTCTTSTTTTTSENNAKNR